jgi:hypothetical protein
VRWHLIQTNCHLQWWQKRGQASAYSRRRKKGAADLVRPSSFPVEAHQSHFHINNFILFLLCSFLSLFRCLFRNQEGEVRKSLFGWTTSIQDFFWLSPINFLALPPVKKSVPTAELLDLVVINTICKAKGGLFLIRMPLWRNW